MTDSLLSPCEPVNTRTVRQYSRLVRDGNLGELSDNSITSLLMWANPLDIRQQLIGGTLFFDIRYTTGQRWLMQPVFTRFCPEDIERALALYPGYDLITLSPQFTALLEEAFPQRFSFEETVGYGDYIYEREALADERFYENIDKSFRPSYLRRLMNEHNFRFERFEDGDTSLGGMPVESYYAQISTKNELLGGELYGIRSLMSAPLSTPGAMSGRLLADGKPVGVILCGEISPEMIDITFIKNEHELRGSGVLLLHMAARAFGGYRYMNFQEDMNIPSLRRYKSALNPCRITQKFIARRREG